jgi:flagellar assembly protein FliH
MGRVVKGAIFRAERYALDVPEIAPPSEPLPSEALGVSDDYGFFGAGFDELPAAAPVDVAAIKAQAQALLDEAAHNAEALLADAHARARAMVEDAAVRAEGIAAEARGKAHDEGFAAGRAQADGEMHEMLATMRGLLEMARLERHKMIESAEPELVRLALGIAERVLHQQIALDRGVVVEMAKTAIARLIERDTVTVRVNPADLERMREHREELIAIGDIRNLRVVEDKRVDRGGVVIETEAGTIDARIGTQLEEARKVLHIEEDLVVEPASLTGAHQAGLRTARAS